MRSGGWTPRPVMPGLWDGPAPGDRNESFVQGQDLILGVPAVMHEIVHHHPLLVAFLNWGRGLVAAPDILEIFHDGALWWRGTAMPTLSGIQLAQIISPGTTQFVLTPAANAYYLLAAYCWQSTQRIFDSPLNDPPGT